VSETVLLIQPLERKPPEPADMLWDCNAFADFQLEELRCVACADVKGKSVKQALALSH